MIALLEVARREIEERRLYLAGGLLLGLLPLAAPLLPLAAAQPALEVREASAVMLFWIASLLFSVLLGVAVFGGDLAERRLGFYFSRPLAGWTVLCGKLGGTLLVGLAAAALVLLPTAALGRRLPAFFFPWESGAGELPVSEALGVWLVGMVVLVLAAHYLRTVALARSPWRLLDLAGVVMACLVLRWITGGLLGGSAPEALSRAFLYVAVGLLAGLLLAVAVQVLRGRTSVRRGHLLLSSTLWVVMGVVLAAAGGYANWVLSAGPEDLEQFSTARPAPAGEWLALSGPAKGRADYHPAFLYRVPDGARLPLPAGDPIMLDRSGGLLFSTDGSTACWAGHRSPSGGGLGFSVSSLFLPRSELICATLADTAPRPRATGIMLSPFGHLRGRQPMALSADGGLLGKVEDRLLTVEELHNRRLLVSRRLPSEVRGGELFFDRSGKDLYLLARDWSEGPRLDVWRLEVASGSFERRFRLEGLWAWSRDPKGERLLLQGYVRSRGVQIWLADLAGAELSRVEAPGEEPVSVARFLADGRLILQSENSELWLAARDGSPVHRLPRRERHVRLGGQPTPDTLLVTYGGHGTPRRRVDRTYLLELASGAERLLGDGLVPLSKSTDGPAGLASRLLSRPGAPGRPRDPGPHGRELLLLDPETLELRVVLAAG